VNYTFKGEGVARVSPPDSVRLDFFLDNGIGGGYATLVGDDISAPGPDFVRSLLPPAPMLWAALGRLAVPAAADTAVRIDGDTTRADIGKDPRWRVALVNRDIRAVDLIHGENLEQSLSRTASGDVRYEHRTAHRLLELNITRVDTTSAFDSAIWH
jgi:hypothetical protein